MDGGESSACPGPAGRYVTGLCAAGVGLCAAGWLVLTPFAFGYRGRGWHAATLTDLATGGGLAVICVITLLTWTLAWRRVLRADGVLARPERSPARARRRGRRRGRAAEGQGGGRADPEQVLTALRALLAPVLDAPAEDAPAVAAVIPGPRGAPEEAAQVPRVMPADSARPQVMPAGPEGIAVIESMLAGAELLMTGCDEEEAW
jgi:hypothetical protein